MVPALFTLALLGLLASSASAHGRTGRPAPSFAGPRHYETGAFAESIAIADLSGDRVPDIVPAHGAFFDDSDPRTGAVTVFINRGDGSFESGQAYQTSSPGQRMGSWSVAADDLNGDGLRDLAAANPGAHSVSVLLNRGAGTFLPAVNYRIRGQPWDVAIRDLNGDHQADIVIATPKTVSALMNSGSGSFARSAHARLARTLWLLPWPT